MSAIPQTAKIGPRRPRVVIKPKSTESCLVGPFALKLTSSFISVGWEGLMGDPDESDDEVEDAELGEWGGDVISRAMGRPQPVALNGEVEAGNRTSTPSVSVLGVRETAPLSEPPPPNPDPNLNPEPEASLNCGKPGVGKGEGKVNGVATGGGCGDFSFPPMARLDRLEALRSCVETARKDNEAFFRKYMDSLQQMPGAGEALAGVEVGLNDYEVSSGDVAFLQTVYDSGMKAFVSGGLPLGVRMSGGVVSVVAAYIRRSKTESPTKGKDFVVRGPLKSIVRALSPLWLDVGAGNLEASVLPPTEEAMEGLLDLLSGVCSYPPVDDPVLPSLDPRLMPALGLHCAVHRKLSQKFPEVGEKAVRDLLEARPLPDLVFMAQDLGVGTEDCETKGEVVQVLLGSGCDLGPGLRATPPDLALPLAPPEEEEEGGGSGESPEPPPPSPRAVDREALVALHKATSQNGWAGEENWCVVERAVGEWEGCTTDDLERVIRVSLVSNNLQGPIPLELGQLSMLKELNLDSNMLTGPIPMELGNLSALERLVLQCNKLSGNIPKELGKLKELRVLNLRGNHIDGPIPRELGGLRNLTELWLLHNRMSGNLPKELCELRLLEKLVLADNPFVGKLPGKFGQLRLLNFLRLNNTHVKVNKSKLQKMFPNCKDIAV